MVAAERSPQLIVDKLSHDPTLDVVVVSGAQQALDVGGRLRSGRGRYREGEIMVSPASL